MIERKTRLPLSRVDACLVGAAADPPRGKGARPWEEEEDAHVAGGVGAAPYGCGMLQAAIVIWLRGEKRVEGVAGHRKINVLSDVC